MLPIQISGHNVEITEALHDFTNKKFERLYKHSDNITSIHVFLDIDKINQSAEATVHIPGHEIFAQANSEDMYKTISMLVDKLIRQIDKHKGKLEKKHHSQ